MTLNFYQSISAYYDLIFPVDPQTVAFIAHAAAPRSRILDIACGTGGHSLALAERGHRVTGIDLDGAMIDAARNKARDLQTAPEFRIMDMLSMARRLEPGFDLVFCIGNSLVHLETDEEIRKLLADCYSLLVPGGGLILQIINYDRILAEGLTSLPALRDDAAGLEFVRIYDLDAVGKVVIFRTELRVTAGPDQRVIRNQIPLRILRSEQLRQLVQAAGFQDLQLLGGFDGKPFSLQSLPLILSARKG